MQKRAVVDLWDRCGVRTDQQCALGTHDPQQALGPGQFGLCFDRVSLVRKQYGDVDHLLNPSLLSPSDDPAQGSEPVLLWSCHRGDLKEREGSDGFRRRQSGIISIQIKISRTIK
ncbi:hypothetical protein [Methylobacterium sp. Leaf117]|uniref:hypothetical protein n=1 Tax=Methylobacterium sp. Leaf117 TaxID=1736260 RepID=UPI001AEBFE36|nr:hypothetical protein [Methylobacterium sp. Leaf117]